MELDRWDLSGDCTGKEGYCEERISCQHKGDYVRYDEHIETLHAKDAEIAALKNKLESAEALLYKKNCAIGRADTTIQTLTHANARLRAIIYKLYQDEGFTEDEMTVYSQTVYQAQHALAGTEGQKGA